MEDYKKKYENLLHDIDIAIAGQKEGETKIVLQNIKERNTESEDERIRKGLINTFSVYYKDEPDGEWDGKPVKDIIAWLEKQGKELSSYNPYKVTVEAIAEMVDKYSYPNSDMQDFYNNIKVKCKDAIEYDKILLEKQGEQKPIGKIDHKFKVGDWIINSEGLLRHIIGIDKAGYQTDNGWLTHEDYEKNFHLWTIQDAKEGDVLVFDNKVFIYAHRKQMYSIAVAHCFVDSDGDFYFDGEFGYVENGNLISLATKEQRDFLFTKMKEAGYEWDGEKKELKKIESTQPELPNGEDYGIDSLYHAARILEKTLGDVEGYQSDDGILEHQCAIEAVNRLYKQNHSWSEEDECMMDNILNDEMCPLDIETINWLKSLKKKE